MVEVGMRRGRMSEGSLSHCHTVTAPHYHTVTQSQPLTIPLSHHHNPSLSQCHTIITPHYHNVTPQPLTILLSHHHLHPSLSHFTQALTSTASLGWTSHWWFSCWSSCPMLRSAAATTSTTTRRRRGCRGGQL